VVLTNLLSLYFSYYITDEGDYYKPYYYDANYDIYSSIGNLVSKTDLTKEQIEFHTTLYNNLLLPLVKFIRKCTEFDPRERYNTKEAAEDYKKLLPLFDTYLDASKVSEGLANQRILNESPDIPYIKTPGSNNSPKNEAYIPPNVRVPNQVNELDRILEDLQGLEEEQSLEVSPKTSSRKSKSSRKK
jgi:serine/threonine protein kinase